ncbi:MAG: Polyphosphate kinase, partial [Verrucomicrobiota bacterium]
VLTNKGLYLLALLRDPASGELRRAVVPVPRILPRILGLSDRKSFTFLSQVIQLFIHRLFPGLELQGSWAFRITRNSDLYVDEEEAVNLLEAIEDEIRNLRKGAPVRLEIEADVPEGEMQWLLNSIHLTSDNAFRIPGPVNMLRLGSLIDMVGRPDLLYPNFVSVIPPECAEPTKLYERIAEHDIILHHPYESFSPVVDFIRQAAKDETVVAIKLTLYRTSGDSPVVEALKEAARNGKQVTALVELRARFDELNNIEWARQLEEAGAHVVYGLAGLKTHCKACLVVRQEKDGLRRYAHLGTGNYNPKTARIYTDFSLLTCDEEITADVGLLFNVLTGNLASPKFKHLLIAPFDLARRIVELIKAETANAKAGKPATIFAKVNSLVDPEVINAFTKLRRRASASSSWSEASVASSPASPARVIISASAASSAASSNTADCSALKTPRRNLSCSWAAPTGCHEISNVVSSAFSPYAAPTCAGASRKKSSPSIAIVKGMPKPSPAMANTSTASPWDDSRRERRIPSCSWQPRPLKLASANRRRNRSSQTDPFDGRIEAFRITEDLHL